METACRRFAEWRNNAVFLVCSPRKRGWLLQSQWLETMLEVFPAQAGVAPAQHNC